MILLTLYLLPALLLAETDIAAQATMRLTVKPVLCITDKQTPRCDMSFLVFWQSDLNGYYCLFSDFDETPVRCWNDESAGRLTDDRIVQRDFSYWMTGDEHDMRLAIVTVEVLRMDTDDRRRRRRTRHVWDIN